MMMSRINRMAQRVRRYGFIRTLVFFVWCIGPLWLRQIIDRSVILICRWLNIQQLKTVVNQTEIFIIPKCPWIVYRYFIVGRYDEEEINCIRGWIPAHYTFMDVGANFGVWTFSLAEHFREVLAFEPDPECFACLKKTKAHLGNSHVSLFPLALSDENREGTLFPSQSSKGDGRIYNPMDNERLEGIKIPIRTFDALAQEEGLNKEFIFLKLDVQGAEPCVLRGMQNSFKRAKDVLL